MRFMELVDDNGDPITNAHGLAMSIEVYEELIVFFQRLEEEGKLVSLPPISTDKEEDESFYEIEAIHVWKIADTPDLAIDIYPRPCEGDLQYYCVYLNRLSENTYTYLGFSEFFELLSRDMKKEFVFCFDLWLELEWASN